MGHLRRVWAWLQRRWRWVAVGLAVVLAWFGFGRWRARRRVVNGVALRVAKEERRMLERLRADRISAGDESEVAIARIDELLVANARAIVEAHDAPAGMTNEEVADEFARLGF